MYIRNILTLLSGGALAMAIPFLGAPILGRLYTPTDYAGIATYLSLVNIGSVFATLQFQHGIIAARTEASALRVLKLTLSAVALTCLVITAALAVLRALPGLAFNDWFLLLPLSLFLVPSGLAISMYANRHSAFRALAIIPVATALANTATAILLGFTTDIGASGLFSALLLSHLVNFAGNLMLLRRLPGVQLSFRRRELRVALLRNRSFLQFSLPAILINTLNSELLTLALAANRAPTLLGAYSRTKQLVSAPINIITTSVNKAYYQRGALDYRTSGSCRDLVVKTALGMFLAGTLPFVSLLLWGPRIFEFVLGPDWGVAGHIAQILAPMFWLRFTIVPLIPTYQFTDNQKVLAKLSGIYLVATTLSLLVTSILFEDPMAMVYSFSATYILIYVTQLVNMILISRNSDASNVTKKQELEK